MEEIYYIIEGGQQKGPYSKQGLRLLNITPDTYVWRAGMSDWQHASSLPEIADVFMCDTDNSAFGGYAQPEPEVYYAMKGSTRIGPFSVEHLLQQGITPDTPVWRSGMADWLPAGSVPELRDRLMNGAPSQGVPPTFSPRFSSGPQYAPGSQMPQSAYPQKSSWMTWSIVATIAGFLCGGCIAGIFGIVGINKAQKANALYAAGDTYGGDAEDGAAKTWTIISLVITAISFVTTIILIATEATFLSNLYNF